MKILAFDIENIAPKSRPWGLFNQNIGLSQVEDPGHIISWAARWVGDPKKACIFKSVYHNGQQDMLESIWDLFDEADAVMGWNSEGFDTRKLNWEFKLHQIRGGGKYSPVKQIDLMKEHKRENFTLSNKLEFVAAQLLGETKVTHEGFKLWLAVEAENPKAWEKFRRYNIQDTNLLIKLYEKMLPWIKHPNQNLYNNTEGACPSCGKFRLEDREPRHTLTRSYHQYQCGACRSWSTGPEIKGSRTSTKGI